MKKAGDGPDTMRLLSGTNLPVGVKAPVSKPASGLGASAIMPAQLRGKKRANVNIDRLADREFEKSTAKP